MTMGAVMIAAGELAGWVSLAVAGLSGPSGFTRSVISPAATAFSGYAKLRRHNLPTLRSDFRPTRPGLPPTSDGQA